MLMVSLMPTAAEFGKRSESAKTLEGVETEQMKPSPN